MIENKNGFDTLSKLSTIYADFINSPSLSNLVILGRPRVGKRWILKNTLEEQKSKYVWPKGNDYSDQELTELLTSDNVVILYESTIQLFGRKKLRECLLNTIQSKSFSSKLIIIDDPYTKRPTELNSVLNGIEFTFVTSDLLQYIKYCELSLAKTHNVSTESIERILEVYSMAIQKKLITEQSELGGVQFSVSGVMSIAKLICENKNPAVMFPQEIFPIARQMF